MPFVGLTGFATEPAALSALAPMLRPLGCTEGSRHHWDETLGVVIGWTGEPFRGGDTGAAWSADGHVLVLLTGEVFGPSPSRSIGDSGLPPAAVAAGLLAERYRERGLHALAELNGWFCGVILDRRTHRLSLFTDRFGLGRVYYTDGAGGGAFATRASALLAAADDGAHKLNMRGLAEYHALGCALEHRTLFEGVSLLPAGAVWTFRRDGGVERSRYFDPATWEQQPALRPAEYGEQLRQVFANTVPRYVNGSLRVGMSVTGGLDSRLILAWLKAAPGSLPCYTFGGPYRECADVRIGRALAAAAGQSHRTLRIGADFLRDFPALAAETIRLTDGAMDVSGAVELYANRLVREIAPVRLTGNYGSEILRLNVAFRPGRLDEEWFTPEFVALLREAAAAYRKEAACHRLSFIAFKQVPWHHFARLAVERSQVLMRSPYLDNELVALAYQAPAELAGSPAPLLQLIHEGCPAFDRIPTDRWLSRSATTGLSRLLRAWPELTAKAEYAYDYGMPQWLARLDGWLSPLRPEQLFLGRHKFYHFRIWYRDALHEYVRAAVANGGDIPACYRPEVVRRRVQEHLAGRANHTLMLHRLLSVQLIQKTLLRGS